MTTKNMLTNGRIEFLSNVIAKQTARLATLAEGSAAHKRCSDSLDRNNMLMVQLHTSLNKRAARQSAFAEAMDARKAQRGERFEVAVGDDLVDYSSDEQNAA